MKTVIVQLIFALLIHSSLYSINSLSVRDPDISGSKDGYIDKAVVVIEPHGAYAEQSIYLTYSDHGQYSSNKQLEIVHRFELPEGAVVNDLWLWMGDSVMQAIILDTWRAQEIYDSITSFRKDPALLKVSGTQFELHVYPLMAGSYRRIKINYIVPTLWIETKSRLPLPLKLLKSNNEAIKPLDILFRTKEDIWGVPYIYENPTLIFNDHIDTIGYKYKRFLMDDISLYQSINLTYSYEISDGYTGSAYTYDSSTSYFQIGLDLQNYFGISLIDTMPKKNVIAIDLSGYNNNNISQLSDRLDIVIPQILNSGDSVILFAAAGGEYTQIPKNSWSGIDKNTIRNLMDSLKMSIVANNVQKKPHILFCDGNAKTLWSFPGLDSLATYEVKRDLMSSLSSFHKADIIAAYNHGYEKKISSTEAQIVYDSLMVFFARGGVFLSYYDHNRPGKEKLAHLLIEGFEYTSGNKGYLFRNEDGIIGPGLPVGIWHNSINGMDFTDDSIVVEMTDDEGRNAIMSKRFGNGRFTVTGIWSYTDDASTRQLLAVPMLGLNQLSEYRQLDQVLDSIAVFYKNNKFDRCLILSNSDELITNTNKKWWLDYYLNRFQENTPEFSSINLLTGDPYVPPVFSSNGMDYYGSGYQLKELADSTGGTYFELHDHDWNYITNNLIPDIKRLLNLNVDATIDNGDGSLNELREVNPLWNNSLKPVFMIGEVQGRNVINLNISAKFYGIDSTFTQSTNIFISADSTNVSNILPTMLANEKLKDYFQENPVDTMKIVNLAMKYNILSNFTSLIALEPHDTIQFMKEPLKENEFVTTEINVEDFLNPDSLQFVVSPNPFKVSTNIEFILKASSNIKVDIVDINGVIINSLIDGKSVRNLFKIKWDGNDFMGKLVEPGIYFSKISVNDRTYLIKLMYFDN